MFIYVTQSLVNSPTSTYGRKLHLYTFRFLTLAELYNFINVFNIPSPLGGEGQVEGVNSNHSTLTLSLSHSWERELSDSLSLVPLRNRSFQGYNRHLLLGFSVNQ